MIVGDRLFYFGGCYESFNYACYVCYGVLRVL
jgi:hypothetical protein